MTNYVFDGTTYNSNGYDAVTNPGGLAEGGHRVNLLPMLQDVLADVAVTLQMSSTTSLAIGTGSKVFTPATMRGVAVGVFMFAIYDASNYMFGQVTTVSATQITVNVTATAGSGTYAAWTLQPTGPQGATGSAGAEYWSTPALKTYGDSPLTPSDKSIYLIDTTGGTMQINVVGAATRFAVVPVTTLTAAKPIRITPPSGKKLFNKTANDSVVIKRPVKSVALFQDANGNYF
jgi:hypothetical protein